MKYVYFRTEVLLQRVEERNGIVRRWTPTSPEYISTKAIVRSKSKEKLKKEIRQGARERWYLLQLNQNMQVYVCK